jgi:hypothetical protein
MATACFLGFPAFISALMFLPTDFALPDLSNGMVKP